MKGLGYVRASLFVIKAIRSTSAPCLFHLWFVKRAVEEMTHDWIENESLHEIPLEQYLATVIANDG